MAGRPRSPMRELVAGIRLLAETTGIFAETAGGVTVAAAKQLARVGRLRPDDEVVLCITGNGLKTLDAVADALPPAPVIAPRLSAVADVGQPGISRQSARSHVATPSHQHDHPAPQAPAPAPFQCL